MKTITLEVADDFIDKFKQILKSLPAEKVTIKKDYMRQELEKRLKEIDENQELLAPYQNGLEDLKNRLISKYANS